MYDKFFKCEAGPTAKKNDLSGKSDTAAAEVVAANAAPQPPPPPAPASAETILPVEQPVQTVVNQTTAIGGGTSNVLATVNGYQSPTNNVVVNIGIGEYSVIPNPGTVPVPITSTNLTIAPVTKSP